MSDSDADEPAEDSTVDDSTVDDSTVEEDPADQIETLYGWPVTTSAGQRVIHVDRGSWVETAQTLFADGWEMCVDITAVDYSANERPRALPDSVTPERFEVVASFISHRRRERLRARAQVPEASPSIDSLFAIYPGTDFSEREVFDLFGITFDGHPDLSRILMPETWEGHPLRKDFAIGAIPVQFKGTQPVGE